MRKYLSALALLALSVAAHAAPMGGGNDVIYRALLWLGGLI